MIYLFNQTEKLIDVIDEASLADFTHTIELNQFDRASFEIPVDYKPEIIKEAQFFGFQSRDRAFCLFRISEKSYDIGLTIQGIDRAESDLHSFIIEDKRPGGTASDVLREILKGTGYQLGDIDGLTINGNMSFYYISVRQALVKLIESYACEFRVRYTFVENKIIGRYIDLNQRFGRKTGHQFEYGSNILNIIYEESSDEVVTALIGRGKGEQSTDESGEATGGYGRRIQFKDVSWSVAKGDPVDKPAGQNYVANETARNIYGLHQNGVIKHRFGVYTNEDIEDPVELLKATYKELQRLFVPIVTFKANLLDLANAIEQDIWIGDSVGIVRDQIGIAFEARIHKLIIDKLDDNRSAVELGDYQTLQAKDRSTRQQAIKDAVSGFSESLIKKAIANEVDRRNKEFDEKIRVNKLEFDNELQRAKERAEEVKRQISSEIDKKFQSFDNASIQEAKRRAEEALRSAGASSSLAQEAKRIGLDSVAKLEEFKRQATSAQTALSGYLDALKRTVTSEVNQASEYRRTTTEVLSRMTGQMNGFATKSEVKQGIDGLTQTFAKMKVGGRNYAEDYDFSRGLWVYSQGDGSPIDWKITNGEYNVKGTTNTWKQMQIHSKEGSRTSGKSSTALLELEIGETYTISFQGICYSGSSNVWVSLRANRTSTDNPEIMYGNFNLTPSWQTYQVTIPALTKPDNFDFWRIILGYNGIGHVAFRKVELTRSSTRIDAGPAPEDGKTDLVVAKSEFQKTADALSAKMSAVESYVGQDGQRQEALQRYTREESAKQAMAVRELVARDFVGKASYQEDVRAIERKFEGITNPQNGSIATQIAKYKNAVDGRFTEITSLISSKASQADFQRVKETSQLYERILGNTENGIANNVARMALTNQLFQVEVAKNVGDGRNYVKNADFREGSKNWKETNISGLNFNYEHSLKNRGKTGIHIYGSAGTTEFYGIHQTYKFEGSKNDNVILSFLASKDGANDFSGIRIGVHCRKNNAIISQMWRTIPNSEITGYSYKKIILTFNLPVDIDEVTLMVYGEQKKTINIYISEIKFEKGSNATPFTLAPEDTEEAVKTVQSQLAGSWAVQNINSEGDLISGINLGANGHNRFDGKLTHITGETLIDKAVIKSAMVDKLTTANFESGSVTTTILDAEAVTADKVRMDQAFANKLVASNIFTDMLAAKEAFINKLRSVVVTATLLEGFQGKIGGFRFGQYTNRNGYFITGINSVSIGMGNGTNAGANRNAFWANWGESLDTPGPKSWYVNTDGTMYCRNEVSFYSTVDFASTSNVNFYSRVNAEKGLWLAYNDVFGEGDNPVGGYNRVVWWSQIVTGKFRQHAGITTASDRKLKENIEPTPIQALDKINALNLVAFDYIKDKTHEEIGLIAQEVLNIIPGSVEKYGGEDNHLTINYSKFVPYLIKAIQELNEKIERRTA